MKIEKAIELLNDGKLANCNKSKEFCKAYDMAIRSIEAWNNLRQKAKEREKNFDEIYLCFSSKSIDRALKGGKK